MFEDLDRSYAISFSTLTLVFCFVLRSKRAVAEARLASISSAGKMSDDSKLAAS